MRIRTGILLLIVAIHTTAQLRINELMTNNVSAVMDDAYNFSMWVEVVNLSDTPVNLSDYFFTDRINLPRKWQGPDTLIVPGDFMVLWFERPDTEGHATFRLEPGGAFLLLMDHHGGLTDFVSYPRQFRNISYGRIEDGSPEWGFFSDFSPGASNNHRMHTRERCASPQLSHESGFYPVAFSIYFETPPEGDTIYYHFSASEPTPLNATRYIPGTEISIPITSILRARSYGANKLPSDINTASYFIGHREYNLPIVSIVTPQAFLTDNTIGIYVRGTNGIPGNGATYPANWNRDWDRPAHVALIDTAGILQVSQEMDIAIAGGWSRTRNPQKSLHLKPKKKFGNNKIDYDVFNATKPGNLYKDILLRNSGNDFYYSMMRDAFMQSLVMHRMNLDYQAYEPAICFMNGTYYGIQNLRERSNADLIYSNHGYSSEEIVILDHLDIQDAHPDYQQLLDFVTLNDINAPSMYEQIGQRIDLDNYLSYMITELFVSNYDWPHNNVKFWKPISGGKWRWILFDLDFGFNLANESVQNFNSLTFALGDQTAGYTPEWATDFFSNIMGNDEFRNRFIDRFTIHLSSTFRTERINHILDSIADKIRPEIPFHKSRWGSLRGFEADINTMKNFSAARPERMYEYIGHKFFNNTQTHNIYLSANIPNASYSFNGEHIQDAVILLRSFHQRNIQLRAEETDSHHFSHWEAGDGQVAIYPELIYSTQLTGDIHLKAIYTDKDDDNPIMQDLPLQSAELNVYPNPMQDVIVIENAGGKLLQISDISGKRVITLNISADYQRIDVSELERGIYFIQTGDHHRTVIKQ